MGRESSQESGIFKLSTRFAQIHALGRFFSRISEGRPKPFLLLANILFWCCFGNCSNSTRNGLSWDRTYSQNSYGGGGSAKMEGNMKKLGVITALFVASVATTVGASNQPAPTSAESASSTSVAAGFSMETIYALVQSSGTQCRKACGDPAKVCKSRCGHLKGTFKSSCQSSCYTQINTCKRGCK